MKNYQKGHLFNANTHEFVGVVQGYTDSERGRSVMACKIQGLDNGTLPEGAPFYILLVKAGR